MQFPTDYKYSKEHTWLRLLENNEAKIGITEFAQSEYVRLFILTFQLLVNSLRKMKSLDLLKQ